MKSFDEYEEIGSINLNDKKLQIIYIFIFLLFAILGVAAIFLFNIDEKYFISLYKNFTLA